VFFFKLIKKNNFMKKLLLSSALTLLFGIGLSIDSPVKSQDFVWGLTMQSSPCSSYFAIYNHICVPSQGGFCQISAQDSCPGPIYVT
jgi:hypothetical protein